MPPLPSLPQLNGDALGVWVAALLSLLVLSAAVGENRVSRVGIGLLIGTAVGYAGAVTWQTVLWPRFQLVWADPLGQWTRLVWLFLGLLLLARGLPSGAGLSSLSLAYLFGVGAALAMGGALLGTVVPQLAAVVPLRGEAVSASWGGMANALLIAVGTGGVLLRFTYTGWGGKGTLGKAWVQLAGAWGRVGYGFLLVGLGTLFAAAIISSLALLASRLQFLLADWLRLTVY